MAHRATHIGATTSTMDHRQLIISVIVSSGTAQNRAKTERPIIDTRTRYSRLHLIRMWHMAYGIDSSIRSVPMQCDASNPIRAARPSFSSI